ncbi:DUF2177 family protein [Phenylobacterium sp. LH3H17]|uniref:DUF2177 family protein n=1 Tax=Phenylobacterium sp. LH3H17 TaxID=2903901 RepID=UPI0020C9C19A|nr:DUF2177 family protein [Phenylobacterium sp. LH3H17]UTP40217.1 DUF2177 family protein [Phenylobacterium sp. LH3H17]
MLKFVIAYFACAGTFAVVDAIWLTMVGPRLYRPALNEVLADAFRLAPAVAFYVIYIGGVLLLAILPAARENAGWTRALLNGALLGFVAYATYDLTNQATLKVWSTRITLADIGWGTLLTACAATAGYFAYRWAEAKFG